MLNRIRREGWPCGWIFDFEGRGGWAAVRRDVDVSLPENWELRFPIRGRTPRSSAAGQRVVEHESLIAGTHH